MQIVKVNHLGFCPGVIGAISLFKENAPLESLGPVVHNHDVVAELELIGVKVVNDISQIRGDKVGIPSHGVSPNIYNGLASLQIIDATCTNVAKVHEIVKSVARDAYVVIFGDGNHTEVKGTLGYTISGMATTNPEAVPDKPYLVFVSQTTYGLTKYKDFISKILARDSWGTQLRQIRVFNTICPVVSSRIRDSIKVAKSVETMLVIGDRASGNTQRLANYCRQIVNTVTIENAKQIDSLGIRKALENIKVIGITAGTSTPEKIITEVEEILK